MAALLLVVGLLALAAVPESRDTQLYRSREIAGRGSGFSAPRRLGSS